MRSSARPAEATLGTTWAVARTAVAAASLLTMIANTPASIVITTTGSTCRGLVGAGATCLLTGGEYTWVTHGSLTLMFAAVASGLLPRFTGLLHPYAAFSLLTVLSTVDGGDQAAMVFSVLAVPLCLADPRRSTWSPWPEENATESGPQRAAVRRSTVSAFTLVLKLQISWLYLQAGFAKLAVPEWTDGTALYYWTIDGYLLPPSFAETWVTALATTPVLLLGAGYGTLVLEFLLGISLLLRPWRVRGTLLVVALLFHAMIALTFAIWSFALTMMALALLLLSPSDLRDWKALLIGDATGGQQPGPATVSA